MKMRTRINLAGIDWWVEGNFKKGKEAKYYLGIGDPGYPADPDDLFDVKIWLEQGTNKSDDLQDILDTPTVDRLIERAVEVFSEDRDYREDTELEDNIPW